MVPLSQAVAQSPAELLRVHIPAIEQPADQAAFIDRVVMGLGAFSSRMICVTTRMLLSMNSEIDRDETSRNSSSTAGSCVRLKAIFIHRSQAAFCVDLATFISSSDNPLRASSLAVSTMSADT